MNILIDKTPTEIIMDKLQNGAEITREDVKALGIFSDYWIDKKLFKASQSTIRGKMLDVMTRESVVVF